MFERLPSGYRLTAAGEEVLELANQMEASSHQLETRVFGRDQSVRGLLRVTLAPPLATHLLMPDFAHFARLHPDIEMEIAVVRRAGESDQPRGRCRDPRRLRPQDPAAQPARPEGTGTVRWRLPIARPASCVACGRARSLPVDRHKHSRCSGLGQRGRGSRHGGAIPDHGRGGAGRCSPARAWHDGTALFHRRRRPPAGEGPRHRSSPVWNGLASYPGRVSQDEARAAVQ